MAADVDRFCDDVVANFRRKNSNSDLVSYARCGPVPLDIAERRDVLAGTRRQTDKMADLVQLRIGSGKDEAEPGQIFWFQITPKALNKQPLATASLRHCPTSSYAARR